MNIEQYQDTDVIRRVLGMRRIAIVGLSGNELRASNFVGRYLQIQGYQIFPVNPREKSILGETSYPTLSDIPDPVDIVNVFRKPEAVPAVATEAVAIGAKCLWLQFGIVSQEAADIATSGGLDVVMDKCMKVEYARYRGRMHWLGFNTNRIVARRAGTG